MAWMDIPEVKTPPPRKRNGTVKGIIAAAVVVVGAAVAYFLVSAKPADPQPKASAPAKAAKPARPARVEPQRPAPRTPAAEPAKKAEAPEPEEKWDDSFITNREKRIKFSKVISVTTNDSGVVNERYRLPNGRTWRRQIDPPPIFRNASDNAIAMVMGGAAGAPIPPVPGLDNANLDAEFEKSLAEPIEISKDDKPWVAALKLVVQNVRQEIAELRRAGDNRPIGAILQDHIDTTNHQAAMRGDALATLEKVRQEMGEAAAGEYLEKVNEQLKKYGVQPVKVGRGRQPKQEGAN